MSKRKLNGMEDALLTSLQAACKVTDMAESTNIECLGISRDMGEWEAAANDLSEIRVLLNKCCALLKGDYND